MMLGDLGADVIKVERPGVGDDTRSWGPGADAQHRTPYYLSVNRNKLSVAADLALERDRGLILDLAAGADVIVDNFLPGMLTARGIDPDAVVAASSTTVWCTITGFGAGNPRPGYDFVAQAECGWMAVTGEPSGEPMKVGIALADVIAGKDAAIAILAALAARGAGRAVNRRLVISLADSARATLINVGQHALVTDTEPRRWGNAHGNIVPYQLFHAADQPIVIAVGNDAQWLACAAALGLDDLAAEEELRTNNGRIRHRDRLVAIIEAKLKTDTAARWVERLTVARVPVGVVKTVRQALEDTGASSLMGIPSSVGGRARLEPPLLDQHGADVRRAGWGAFSELARRQSTPA